LKECVLWFEKNLIGTCWLRQVYLIASN